MQRYDGTGLISVYLIFGATHLIVHVGHPILLAKEKADSPVGIETKHFRYVDGVRSFMSEHFLSSVCF
jgi:hypothetical protein